MWFAERNQIPTCISCGNPLGGDQWCAGHFVSRGSSSALRFDPVNVWLQHNKRCNQALSADIEGTRTTHGYKQGLKNRFGDIEGQQIIDYCKNNNELRKYGNDELKTIRAEFSKVAKLTETKLETYWGQQ